MMWAHVLNILIFSQCRLVIVYYVASSHGISLTACALDAETHFHGDDINITCVFYR